MVFGHVTSSRRGKLNFQQSLDLANIYLKHASKVKDPDIALALCYDTEIMLARAKRGLKDPAMRKGIANAYYGLGRVLENRGHHFEATSIIKKAEKCGSGKAQDQSSPPQSLKITVDSGSPVSDAAPAQNNQRVSSVTMPQRVFAENMRPPLLVKKLPETDERLLNTPQLACCLGLLKDSNTLFDNMEPSARKWLQVVENDQDEQDRLNVLAINVIRTFKKEEIKDSKTVAEVVYLAAVLDKDSFRGLFMEFYDGVDRSGITDLHLLEGLAQMIQGADEGYLHADDLVKTLKLLTLRLQNTHKQSPEIMYQLARAASYVLDAMADTEVQGLDRVTLHEPLTAYLKTLLKEATDPYLVYQAAYAFQALQCVPDNEKLWETALRRTGAVIRGVSGLVSSVKGMDINGFINSLKSIHQGLNGASEIFKVINGVMSLASNTNGFIKGLKEGFSFRCKCQWYSALRKADELIRDGEFIKFKHLVCEVPCRLDPAFQWGVCQRLGEIAANPKWDTRTRRSAVLFLTEMYCKDEDWNLQQSISEWIIIILMRLSSPSKDALQLAAEELKRMEMRPDPKRKGLFQKCRERDISIFPIKPPLPSLASPSLLDRVQNKPDVEGSLRLLRKQRLRERPQQVYIQPQAKASLQAADEETFPLMEKVKKFLRSDQKVFLLLGDSGAGKSTFNKQLESDLWQKYKKATGKIPLHISLPAIDKPEQDMIVKQLRKAEFTEPEIRELKTHREFILICDGYDESQQTRNLYMSNRLNQEGEWKAQMIISCRSEYIGLDYKDRFQPGDRNQRTEGQYQEAVITPFSGDQIEDYIKQYVSVNQPLWEVKEYTQALERVPSLKELVKNPFLMNLSLEVLPRMMDPGETLSAQVTRVALYDQFIEHWLERGKKRLGEKDMSAKAKSAYENLVDEGFIQNGIDFLKKLAVAIYKEQSGQPIVKYTRFRDERTWKSEFFSRKDEKQLLREACPLTRSGNQHRFVHRSLLEYGLALAIYDPQDWKEKTMSTPTKGRRASTNSVYSFHVHGSAEDEEEVPVVTGPDPNSPLAWRYFTNEPSVLQFLSERAQQEPKFKEQLLDYIEHSKEKREWRTAAANAMTILVRAGERFNGANLQGIQIPGADLSYGMFDSAQLQSADMRQVDLHGVWLRQADLSKCKMSGVKFGEQPSLKEEVGLNSCAFAPDGQSLAVSLNDGNIQLYSIPHWTRIRTLSGHSASVNEVVYCSNGNQAVSGSSDKTVRLWDTKTGACIHVLTGHSDDVTSVAFSSQKGAIASASKDGTVRVWDAGTGNCRLVLDGHVGHVNTVAFSPNGDQVASGDSGDSDSKATVRIWDAETGTCHHALRAHATNITSIAYSPDGERIVSASEDGSASVWDTRMGTLRTALVGHANSIFSVAYSPNGDLIASAGYDCTIRLWDADTGSCRQTLTGHARSVRCVAFSPQGDHIASCSHDRTARLWEVGAGVTRQTPIGHNSGVVNVRLSPKTNTVASCGREGTIQLWNMETGSHRMTLEGHTGWVQNITFSPDGNLLASSSNDCTVRLWNVEDGSCRHILKGHIRVVYVVEFSPLGNQVASGSDDHTVRLWDVETGACLYTLFDHTDWVYSIAYSPDGTKIASGSGDRTVRLWNVETGKAIHIFDGHGHEIWNIAYSPLGDTVTSSCHDKLLRIWDVEDGSCRRVLSGHTGKIYIVVYSPDGRQVASSCDANMTRLWDVETGTCLHVLDDHKHAVVTIQYSPKGNLIATGGEDMRLKLWDVESGQCVKEVRDFQARLNSLVWDPREEMDRLITGGEDRTIRMWQLSEDKDRCHIHLRWGTSNGALAMGEASIHDVEGLTLLHKQLLVQRGAVGKPLVRLRQIGEKVVKMAALRHLSNAKALDSTASIHPLDGLPEEQQQQDVHEEQLNNL